MFEPGDLITFGWDCLSLWSSKIPHEMLYRKAGEINKGDLALVVQRSDDDEPTTTMLVFVNGCIGWIEQVYVMHG